MLINNDKKPRNPSAKLIAADIEIIKVYMLGAVNGVCNTHPDEPFSIRILFGGANKNWSGTPMHKLYDYYKSIGKPHEESYDSAKRDAGFLLASVLESDSRKFEIVGKDTGKLYKIV